MDDDIRDRFRGTARSRSTESFDRPLRPVRPMAPRPAARPKPIAVPPPPKPSTRQEDSFYASPRRSKKRRRWPKRLFITFLLLILFAGLGAAGFFAYSKYFKKSASPVGPAPQPAAKTEETSQPTGTIRFIAVGDSLAFESINNAAKKDGNYDYSPMMDNMKPFFAKADIRLCTQTTPAGGDGPGISGYPTFNAPTAWASGFASLGCNVMNLATNHMNDKGQAAVDTTLKTWEGQKDILTVTGANHSAEAQAKVHYFTVKGIKFAHLAYTTISQKSDGPSFVVNKYSDDLAKQQITEAHKNAQLIIVSMNWGVEGMADIKPEQEAIAQTLTSQNVDVIVGGGTHTVQPAKVLNGKDGHQTLVWYSLGSFLTSEIPIENLIGGMAIMDFDVATQKLNDPKFMPVYMHYEWTAAEKAAGNVNARKNFKLYPLDQAAEALAKSLNNTTVDAQTQRITGIITKFVPIKVIKSTEF